MKSFPKIWIEIKKNFFVFVELKDLFYLSTPIAVCALRNIRTPRRKVFDTPHHTAAGDVHPKYFQNSLPRVVVRASNVFFYDLYMVSPPFTHGVTSDATI